MVSPYFSQSVSLPLPAFQRSSFLKDQPLLATLLQYWVQHIEKQEYTPCTKCISLLKFTPFPVFLFSQQSKATQHNTSSIQISTFSIVHMNNFCFIPDLSCLESREVQNYTGSNREDFFLKLTNCVMYYIV